MRRKITTGVVAFLLVISLSACSSSTQYSAGKSVGMFAAIPKDWKKISQTELHARELEATDPEQLARAATVLFQEAYSPDKSFQPKDAFSVATPKSVIVLIRSRSLTVEEINAVSYNWLRDVVFKLTTWLNNPEAKTTPSFNLLQDSEVVESGGRGVYSVFSLGESSGAPQTVNQAALVSNDRKKLYALIVRSNTAWYKEHSKEIDNIVTSFTVRGTK